MNCEQVRELLEAYVLGALDAETHAAVEQHLAGCAECRRLAEEYRTLANRLPDALALASPLRPPDAIKARLLQAVSAPQAERAPERVSRSAAPRRRLSLRNLRTFALVASLALVVLSFALITHLSVALAHEQRLRARLLHETELIFEVVDSEQTTRYFLAPVAFDSSQGVRPPYGKIFVRADMPYVVGMTGRMPPPPAGQAYHLWLFNESDPQYAGAMVVDSEGFGSLVYEAGQIGPTYTSAQLLLSDQHNTPTGTPVLEWQADESG